MRDMTYSVVNKYTHTHTVYIQVLVYAQKNKTHKHTHTHIFHITGKTVYDVAVHYQ